MPIESVPHPFPWADIELKWPRSFSPIPKHCYIKDLRFYHYMHWLELWFYCSCIKDSAWCLAVIGQRVSPCNKPEVDTESSVNLWFLCCPLKKIRESLNEWKQWHFVSIFRQNEKSFTTKHFLNENWMSKLWQCWSHLWLFLCPSRCSWGTQKQS